VFVLQKDISVNGSDNFKKAQGLHPLQQLDKVARRKQQVWKHKKDDLFPAPETPALGKVAQPPGIAVMERFR
jgi:hypothetical protein